MFIIFAAFIAGCAGNGEGIKKDEMKRAESATPQPPKPADFILGVGDTIDVAVYKHDDLKRSVKIDRTGMVMFPLAGDVQAAGRSIFEFRDELQAKLSKYVVEPQVLVSISGVQSQKIMVLGEVNSPGILTLDGSYTIFEAITKSGGMTADAKMNNVVLIRRGKEKAEFSTVDLKQAYKSGNLSQDTALQSGDIVYVPAVAIANVSWFFGHLSRILSPITSLESGIVLWPQVKDVLTGEDGTTTTPLAIPAQ